MGLVLVFPFLGKFLEFFILSVESDDVVFEHGNIVLETESFLAIETDIAVFLLHQAQFVLKVPQLVVLVVVALLQLLALESQSHYLQLVVVLVVL